VRTLYLSHNALRSLAGLAQFPALQQLALSHNHIAELAQLRHLRPVSKRLHTLSLDGNPVATLPLYREHCLSTCPALTLLDGQPVDAAQRAAATQALRAEDHLLGAMRADAITLEQVRQFNHIHSHLTLCPIRLANKAKCSPLFTTVELRAFRLEG
jgi:hypothetical protein